ncbi:50S ribosomal protein L19 [Candidatus Gracilibacteria bacterium]|nr:50S ribosomal protein L19 [Candidatus Gracilibacteria bacterium]
MSKIFTFLQRNVKDPARPVIVPGDTIKVHQKIVEGKKERIQIYEGVVIAKHNKSPLQATITVRKIASGVGVERIFPLTSSTIDKIEVVKHARVRRAKLYYIRQLNGRAARLKEEVVHQA